MSYKLDIKLSNRQPLSGVTGGVSYPPASCHWFLWLILKEPPVRWSVVLTRYLLGLDLERVHTCSTGDTQAEHNLI